MPTEVRLSDFLGHWTVTRDITPAQGQGARFEGTAAWRAVQGGAQYHEIGTLRVGQGTGMTAERRYFWAEDLSVYFEDGRLFHHVPAGGGQTTHLCDPDIYVLDYDFAGWPRFELRHRVSGPRKDYAMITQFTRAPVP